MSSLNSGNAFYHSVKNILSSSLLSKNIKLTICCLCWCETWSLALREGHRLRVFENRVLRRIWGTRRDEVTGEWMRWRSEELNPLTRNDHYSGHTAPLTSKVSFYIFIQQI